MPQLHQQTLDELPLPRQPLVGLADLVRGCGLGQTRAFAEAHTIIAQIGLQPVAQLGSALNGLAMHVEQIAPLLGL